MLSGSRNTTGSEAEGVHYHRCGGAPLCCLLFFSPRCHLDPLPELLEWAREYGHEEETEEAEEEEEREVEGVAGARL